MCAYLRLALFLAITNLCDAASPVLPIELISRNAQGHQQSLYAFTALNGISTNGEKVAFSISDRAFFGEPPPPPPMPGSIDIPIYGQVALWHRGNGLRPLVNFRDEFGATSFLNTENGLQVKFFEDSSRICLPVSGGNVVTGIRQRGLTLAVCSAHVGSPYEYLLGPDGNRASSGVYGNEQFDLYSGQFQFGAGVDDVGNLALKDRHTGIVEFVALGNDNQIALSGPGNVSNNGRWVVFISSDNNLVFGDSGQSFGGDFFIRDRLTRTTQRVLRPDGREMLGAINGDYDFSADGRFLAFASTGDVVEPCLTGANGMPSQGRNSEPIFVHDFQTNTTECISLTQDGTAFGNSYLSDINRLSISGDGRFVAFQTRFPADPDDSNGTLDIYVRDRLLNRTIWVSQGANGAPGNAPSFQALISENGRWLAFQSYASNLVPNDTNGGEPPPFPFEVESGGDIFLRDLSALSAEAVQVPAGSNWGWALLVLGLLGFGMRAR